ncbi:MAG: dihydrofolate reductase family protein [Caldilineaceae bacterium]
MSKLRFRIAMSLDGYVAGPNQSLENPLGEGGMRLHEWAFALQTFRETHGMEGGEANQSSQVLDAFNANMGATVMGRNMFGGYPGDWSSENPWNGWWGEDPPFHHPVFVITQYAREPLVMQGGTIFYFVTDGIESALAQARKAAAGKDISLGGGANVAQQYLAAGLVDEMLIHLVPILLGSGERLFEHLGDKLHGLKLVQTVPTADVIHLKFVRG